MSDVHVLTGEGNSSTLVFHIPVPILNNAVGIPYRTALANSGLGGTTTMSEGTGAGQISTAEKAQIEAGEIYELVTFFPVESGGSTPAQLRASIRKWYQQLAGQTLTELQARLRYFGYTDSGS